MVGDQGPVRQPDPDHVGAIDGHPCPGMFSPDIDIGTVAMDLPDSTRSGDTILGMYPAGGKKKAKKQKAGISHTASRCDPKGTSAGEEAQLIQVEYGKYRRKE